MNKHILALIILLIANVTLAQTVKFEKLFDKKYFAQGNDLATFSNGDYLVGGISNDSSDTFTASNVMLLMRVNNLGSTVWANQYDYRQSINYANVNEDITKVFPMPGGKIVFFGNIDGNGIEMTETDSMGNTIWAKRFFGNSNDLLSDAIVTSDNYFLVNIGWACMKVDTAGNILWSETFNPATNITSILEINACYYLISGNNFSDSIPVIKIASDGSYVTSFNWNIPSTYIAGSKTVKTHDNYIVNASTDDFNDLVFFKSDTSGNIIWSKKMGYISAYAFSLTETPDSGFALVADKSCDAPYNFLWIKTDALGDTLHTNIYGILNENHPYAIIPTPDNGYLMTGDAADYLYLVKTDSLGLSGCNEYCPNLSVTNIPATTSAAIYTNSNATITTFNSSAFITTGITSSTRCTNTAEIVYIPDSNFKAALLANHNINTNGDSEIQVTEALAYSDSINVPNLGINDLTGIEAFPNIIELNCNENNINNVALPFNTALTSLYLYADNLFSLDISNNYALQTLDVGNTGLYDLDVSYNSQLTHLECYENQLSSLDLYGNPALTFLSCGFNIYLTSLDVSGNPALIYLDCSRSSLTSLDVSANIALTALHCNDDSLTSLIVQNGHNLNIPDSEFIAYDNIYLNCIQVDSVAYSTANWKNIDSQVIYSTNCSITPCVVYIPDANFKAALLSNPAINTNGDGQIECSEAAAYAGYLDISSLSDLDPDLTGLQAFTSLTGLNCNSLFLDSLNVSSNTALISLNCANNGIGSLDLSSNTALISLNCSNNGFESLDLSSNKFLDTLMCYSGSLTSLDLSSNTALIYLDCDGGMLTSLDVSSDTALAYLDCSFNILQNLDFSSNIALSTLYCDDNWLTSLNVKNGNNHNMPANNFYADDNPALTCIQVDNPAYSSAQWTNNVDPTASFSTDCALGGCSAYFTIAADTSQLHHYIVTNLATGVAPINYYWSWGDSTYDTIPYPSHTYSNEGFYTICLTITDSSGCTSTYCDNTFYAMRTTNTMIYINVVPAIPTSVQSLNPEVSKLIIYPNPAHDKIILVNSSFHANEKASISILNMFGQACIQNDVSYPKSEIDISSLASGIYFVQVTNENGRSVGRFVKQ